jgi:TonB family protein
LIDIIVPRGGKSLIERVIADSKVPVIKHLEGICHTYVDGEANLEMARKIVLNAKMRRTGVCGATETLLIDSRAVASHLKPIIADLIAAGCEVRGDQTVCAIDREVIPAKPDAKARNRPPVYPEDAARRGQQGAVLLNIHVTPDGLTEGIDVVRSSGSASLDRAAIEAARNWRFLPAVKDGVPIPFDFQMNFVFAFD